MRTLKYVWTLVGWLVMSWLAGCTPEYNWREVMVAADHAMIAFPARVQTEQRALQFEGLNLIFSLASAYVGPSVFAVGSAPLPVGISPDQTEALVRGLVQSLAVGGAEPAPGAFKGEPFELAATVSGQPSWMLARVLVHRGMLMQVVVTGPTQALSHEHATEFMRSLALK